MAVTLAALAVPGTAGAARVSTSGTTGPSAEEFVLYRGSDRERNRVQVHLRPNSLVIVDRGARQISLGSALLGRCRVTARQRVECPPYDVVVDLRDRDDHISFVPGTDSKPPRRDKPLRFAEPDEGDDDEGEIAETAIVTGGTGDDVISGTKYADYIAPGPGSDIVDGRGGADLVSVAPDGTPDSLRGGGGVDAVYYSGMRPVLIDLGVGAGGAPGEADALDGFERAHGGSADDELRGSDEGDALYGRGGSDRIDGRGGGDLLVGDALYAQPVANRIVGGDGDDYVDTTGAAVPESSIDCGAGDDVTMGDPDDRLDPSCESAALRFTTFFYGTDWGVRTPVWPVARTGDGSPVYEFRCPGDGGHRAACTGSIALASPPGGPEVAYGRGDYSAPAGETARVPIALTEEGRAAIAAGRPVAVHVTGVSQGELDFGWQQILPR